MFDALQYGLNLGLFIAGACAPFMALRAASRWLDLKRKVSINKQYGHAHLLTPPDDAPGLRK